MATTKKSKAQLRRDSQCPEGQGWRRELYDIIFEADSPAGRWFDIGLLIAILASITLVALETVPEYEGWPWFFVLEFCLTALFTLEYVMRLICVRKPWKYAFSFWGIIDLVSFLPVYATLFVGTSPASFVTLRAVRLLRVFRVLKLWRMMDEADELGAAVWRSRNKIIVFLTVVLVAVTISGTLMFHIESITEEGDENESLFTSIPQAMYWAIVTMTTVGYGDIVPKTTAGKIISAVLILLGYSLIIVPSTFVSTEIINQKQSPESQTPGGQASAEVFCPHCDAVGQRADASYCYRCGERLQV